MNDTEQPPIGRLSQFAPLLVGVSYGLTMHLPYGLSLGDLYWQSRLVFSMLAGVVVAYECRPVLSRIAWSRGMAFAVGGAMLGGIGPLGEWVASEVLALTGLAPFPLSMPQSPTGLILTLLVAGWLMAVLYRPQGGPVNARDLWARFRAKPLSQRVGRVVLLGVAAVVVSLFAGWLDARWESHSAIFYVPLLSPNRWVELLQIWEGTTGFPGLMATLFFLLVVWLRGLVALLPMLPIALVLRARWSQLTMVFALLLFVLGEFAPLVANQPYPSAMWLLNRTLLGLGRSGVLAGVLAALFGILRPRAAGSED